MSKVRAYSPYCLRGLPAARWWGRYCDAFGKPEDPRRQDAMVALCHAREQAEVLARKFESLSADEEADERLLLAVARGSRGAWAEVRAIEEKLQPRAPLETNPSPRRTYESPVGPGTPAAGNRHEHPVVSIFRRYPSSRESFQRPEPPRPAPEPPPRPPLRDESA